MHHQISEAASNATYATSGGLGFLGLITWDAMTFIVGVILGLATFFTNRHYKKKHYELEREKFEYEKSKADE